MCIDIRVHTPFTYHDIELFAVLFDLYSALSSVCYQV